MYVQDNDSPSYLIEFVVLNFSWAFFAPRSSTVPIIFHVLNASPKPLSDLADDAELSSSVSKLWFKVRNGSLLKVVAPRCKTPTLIFRAVAFQHFIPVLQSPPSPTASCCQSFSLVVLIFLAFRFFSSTDISNTATDFAGQKIYMVYLVHYIDGSLSRGSCHHHGPLKI